MYMTSGVCDAVECKWLFEAILINELYIICRYQDDKIPDFMLL